MKHFFLVLAIFSLTKPSAIYAQCDETTKKEIVKAGLVFISMGYKLTHDIFCGRLNHNEYSNHYVQLDRGWEYKITAACDGDCGDIDLALYDENGNLIDSDLQRDDNPILTVSPRWSGRFKIKVIMADCRISPCKFGIAVFGK